MNIYKTSHDDGLHFKITETDQGWIASISNNGYQWADTQIMTEDECIAFADCIKDGIKELKKPF